ncbi:MAG: hypothetical protein JWO37_3932 [Acidimicrobiales bacterium]|jgi:hypothetical protein|nr:hypothetical protein [Acidimicrobiales bacterium]
MTLQVVGAGLGRTGTHSLKVALEQLVGGPCYHMIEVFGHPEHVPLWQQAADGEPVVWDQIFGEFAASVDWPASAFWEQQAAAYPDAIILLSARDPAGWWTSVSDTIFQAVDRPTPPEMEAWHRMVMTLFDRTFTTDWRDERAAIEAYERHNEHVRATAPPHRLVEWAPGDGWEPLCQALGLPVPEEAFPHVNSTAEFRAMAGLDPLTG